MSPQPDAAVRVALVTGAARGIGAATVLALVEAGWHVVATDRCADDPALRYPLGSRAELDALVARANGSACGPADDRWTDTDGTVRTGAGTAVRAVAVVADTRDAQALARAVDTARTAFGGLDAVVAAAGVVGGGVPLWQMPDDEVAAVLDVNLTGAVTAARVCLPVVLERPSPRSGRFVAVASAAATRGLAMLAAYCAAKAGVTGLVRGLAAELRGTGVTANAVSPGSTDTPILAESARLYGLEDAASFAPQQPIERLIRPEEVAAAIRWLLSAEAAAVTGATFAVDGGLSL